jgi:hypothetical protein
MPLPVSASYFTARLYQLSACSILLLWSNTALWTPAWATEPSSRLGNILGNCGSQPCQTLLETLRQQWWQVQEFEASCPRENQTLGMAADSERHNVSFYCWDKQLNAQGERSGFGIGRLPLPGQEANFRASVCDTNDCRTSLAALSQRFPAEIPQLATDCAIRSGTIVTDSPADSGDASQTDLICNSFSYEVTDLDGDGFPDGDNATSTGGPIATVWAAPPDFLNAVTSNSVTSKVTGDCGPDPCERLLRALQTQRPLQIRPYTERCGHNQILELEATYIQNSSSQNQLSSVSFICWSPPDPNGARLSFRLNPTLDLTFSI